MKLFVYYSLSGNGEAVAARMAGLGYTCRRAVPEKPMPKAFFLRIMKGGFLAGIGAKEKLRDFDASAEGADEVAVGSPIWNGRLTPAVNAVLSGMDLTGRRVRFVLWSASGEAAPAVKRLAKEYPGADVTILKEPKADPTELDKLAV